MSHRRLRALRALIELDAKELLRDWGALFFSFAFPLFFVVVLAFQSGRGPAPTRVGVVDSAQAADAAALVSLLGRDGVLLPERVSPAAGRAALEKGDLKALFVVPDEGLRGGAVVQIQTDPRYTAMMRMALDSARLALAAERTGFSPPFSVGVTADPALARGGVTFIFPGILALALLQLGLFGTATPLLRARDRGTLRHLSTTPAPRLGLLGSQLVVRLGVSMLQMALLVGCALVLVPELKLGVTAWLGLAPAALAGAAMLIALGYALAGLPSSHNGGTLMTLAVNFVFLFGGAIFFDPSSSTAASLVAYAVPLTYLTDLFRQLLLGVPGLLPAWIDALAVLGFTAVAAAIAMKTFRFEMAR